MSTLPSVEEKQLLEKRYEDLEFVDEIADDLKCGRCRRLTIRHYFSQCGHVFCANCRRLLTDGPCKCPQCKTLIIHMAEQKVEFEQRINAVKVTCPNKKYGCPVVTTLLLLLEHLHQCKETEEASLPAELTLDEVTKSMLNRFVEISKQMNHVVSKVDQLEQKVNEIDQLQQELNKIDKLEQNVNKIDQMEQKVNKIDQLEREVNRLDKLEQKVNKIDQLDHKVNKIDQLEQEVNRLNKLDQKVNKIDQLEQKVNNTDQMEQKINKIDKLEREVNRLDKLEQKVNKIDQLEQEVNRLDKLEQKVNKIDQLEQKINKIDQLERDVNRLDKLEKKVNKIDQLEQMVKKIDQLEQKVNEIDQLQQEVDKLEQKVNKTDQLEQKVNKIYHLEREVNRLDKLEQKVNKIDQLDQKVNKIDQLEQKVNKTNQLEQKINKIDKLEREVNRLDKLEQEVNKIAQLVQKVSQLNIVEMSLEDLKGQIQQIKMKINEQPIDKVVGQMKEIREMKNEMGNLKSKVEGQEQRIGKVNQSWELRANEEQTKQQVELLKRTIEQQNEKMRKLEQDICQTRQLNSAVDKLKVQIDQNIELQKKKWNKYEGDLRASIDDDAVYNFFYCQKYEPTVLGSVVYRWMLKDVTQLMKKKMFDYESEAFHLPGYPFAARAKLILKDDDVLYYSICFKNINGYQLRPNEVIPPLTCILKDVKNKQEKKHQIRRSSYLFKSSMQYDTYYHNNALIHKSWLTGSNYNANDCVEILFLVEPPSIVFRLLSTDGSIIQRIGNYQHRLQLAREQHFRVHCSSYFSTKLNGYQVLVRMWINGFGDFEGNGLTAEILFSSGEYDLQLDNSFKHRTTVTLINQMDLSSHLIQSAEEDISVKKNYCINLASHQAIKYGGYLLNDSLVYQISIQPILMHFTF